MADLLYGRALSAFGLDFDDRGHSSRDRDHGGRDSRDFRDRRDVLLLVLLDLGSPEGFLAFLTLLLSSQLVFLGTRS
jgi:hypothetical protein